MSCGHEKIEVKPATEGAGFSEATLTNLFGHYVSIKNSEREVIWQRWTALLLANSFILGLSQGPAATGLPKVLVAFFGFLLCFAWWAMSSRGWKIYHDYLDEAARFVWKGTPEITNVVAEIGKKYKSDDWIKRSAFGVIIVYALAYLILAVNAYSPISSWCICLK